jgi:hypothetical protein
VDLKFIDGNELAPARLDALASAAIMLVPDGGREASARPEGTLNQIGSQLCKRLLYCRIYGEREMWRVAGAFG